MARADILEKPHETTGDHGKVAHGFLNKDVDAFVLDGSPLVAFCGVVFTKIPRKAGGGGKSRRLYCRSCVEIIKFRKEMKDL